MRGIPHGIKMWAFYQLRLLHTALKAARRVAGLGRHRQKKKQKQDKGADTLLGDGLDAVIKAVDFALRCRIGRLCRFLFFSVGCRSPPPPPRIALPQIRDGGKENV